MTDGISEERERWFTVTEDATTLVQRLVVPGGWLYRVLHNDDAGGGPTVMTVTFVADPKRGGGRL